MYCYGANSQSQNQSILKTRNTFNVTALAPTNSVNMMRATKVDSEPPQARNAALIAKRAQCIPLHITGLESQNRKFAPILFITEAKKCSFLCMQTDWVCPSEAQRFCKNDIDLIIESLIVILVESPSFSR